MVKELHKLSSCLYEATFLISTNPLFEFPHNISTLNTRVNTKMQLNTKRKSKILRPRTAYNFFYKDQRDMILSAKLSLIEGKAPAMKECDKGCKGFLLNTKRGVSKGKRSHRKTHGLISLEQLTKTVAKRWRETSPEIREKYRTLADKDKIRYTNEMMSALDEEQLRHDDQSTGPSHEETKLPQQTVSSCGIKKATKVADLVNSNDDCKAYLRNLPKRRNESSICNYTDFLGITWTADELDALKSLC